MHPRRVVRRHLQRGRSEPFAFSLLVAFLILAFIALWPGLSRQAFLQPQVPLVQRLVAAGLAVLASIPLWYGLAAISRVLARLLGGRGSYYAARLALFCALVSISPAVLLHGLVAGMIGPGTQLNLLGAVVGIAFTCMWLAMLSEVERDDGI